MLSDGAAILDIGGASTKPGQELLSATAEQARALPAIELIVKHFPHAWLSIDTYNAATARAAVQAGAAIVNDVSSGAIDPAMLATAAALQVPYIAMHMQGTPKTMQQNPHYTDVVAEVATYLENKINECTAAGIGQVIIDPGFGFGKTVEHNFALLRGLNEFTRLNRPILAGLSRKSMICKPLHVNPEHALNGTTALNIVALQNGANILRVHDVREAVQVVELFMWVR
jgi:dihydropteroate synthase